MIETFNITSRVIRIKLANASDTSGGGLTGLAFGSPGLIISTITDNEATPTVYTQALSQIEPISVIGTYQAPSAYCCRFTEISPVNHPGWYEIHFSNSRFSVVGAKELGITVRGATNLCQTDIIIQLTRFDLQTAMQRVVDSAGNDVAPASTALSNLVWTPTKAGYLDASINNIPITLLDGDDGVEENLTFRQALRLFTSVLSGKASVSGSTLRFLRKDGVTIALTVVSDASGNRTSSEIGTL